MKWISAFLDRLFALAGAFLFSQIPFFMQQYAQKLSGHVAELQLQKSALEKIAAASGKTLEQYVQKFYASTDNDFVLQGHFMHDIVQRLHELSEGLTALQQASGWEHPFVFIKVFQMNLGVATYETFKPGFAVTFESGAYMFCGAVAGYLFYQLLRKITLALLPSKIGRISDNHQG